MSISFNEIPGISKLFTDYLYSFDKVRELYAFDYRSESGFESCIEEKKRNYIKEALFTRDEVADVLRDQNINFDVSSKTFENIELLRKENTFAVLTGQQVGMLSGNCYTILKALCAVKLSDELGSMFPSYNFVPVFWMEDEDHDFLEINHINIFNRTNELKKISYFEKGEQKDKYTKPVSIIKSDEFINDFIDSLANELQPTDFTSNIISIVRKHYIEGSLLKDSFAGFMNSILKNQGLIFCDPSDRKIKNFFSYIFSKEIASYPTACEEVVKTSADIENEYELQIKPRALNMFYIHNDQRYVVEPKEDELLGLRNLKIRFHRDELIERLKSEPEKFSSNVVLRPILQDYVLPTVAYIGGPSEVSYFAQLKGVYKHFNVTMPVIFPRVSVTFIESKVKNFFERYSVSFTDMINLSDVAKKILSDIDNTDIEKIFTTYRDEFRSLNFEFIEKLEPIDRNLTQNFKNRAEKFDDTFDQMQAKFINSMMKQNESVTNKLNNIRNNLFPGDKLQERTINILYFLNKLQSRYNRFHLRKTELV